MFIRDGIAAVLKVFILRARPVAVFVYARGYLHDRGLHVGEFYLLCLFATLGAMLLGCGGQPGRWFILGLELLTLSIVRAGRAESRLARCRPRRR